MNGLVPHLVHGSVRPMNVGLQFLDVRLVALLLVEHSYSAVVDLVPHIIALLRGPPK